MTLLYEFQFLDGTINVFFFLFTTKTSCRESMYEYKTKVLFLYSCIRLHYPWHHLSALPAPTFVAIGVEAISLPLVFFYILRSKDISVLFVFP